MTDMVQSLRIIHERLEHLEVIQKTIASQYLLTGGKSSRRGIDDKNESSRVRNERNEEEFNDAANLLAGYNFSTPSQKEWDRAKSIVKRHNEDIKGYGIPLTHIPEGDRFSVYNNDE